MNKATISAWAADAFLGVAASSPKMPVNWSSEWISRAGNFVESFVLYDKIVLTEEFESNETLKSLDPGGNIFEFIGRDSLLHSISLRYGLTVDLTLDNERFDELEQEGAKWFAQYDGYVDESEYENILREGIPPITLVRLWQYSLMKEIAQKTNSSLVLPLSLQELGAPEKFSKPTPYHVEKLNVLFEQYSASVKTIEKVIGEPYEGFIDNVPPFLLLLIDQTFSTEMLFKNLLLLRRDYKELRGLTDRLKREIEAESKLSAKNEIVADWTRSWDTVVKSEFKKPSLLRRKISASEFSKTIVNPKALLSNLVQALMEHSDESKSYRRFSVYGSLHDELDSIYATEDKLKKNLNVHLTHRLSI